MKKGLLIFLVIICVCKLNAQQLASIKGKILNQKKEALAGASITVLPSAKSYISDDDGNFVLQNLPQEKNINVKVSYAGYLSQERTFDLSNGSIQDVVFTLKSDVLSLTEIIVVGNTGTRNKLASSVSVSTLKQEDIQKSASRTTAELFRSIPGIKAEASGGDGNTNITVRGVPISAGGSKYLQLQEDGLPLLQFGDMAFATADIFLRADPSISRIEAIRGGSASILATNSPAGIINFISKTGATEGGYVGISSGLDYGNFRTDFNYGAPIANGLTFNVGGFYRLGEGPRTAGYTANNGGQLKLNLTKQFNKGYIRFYAKYLNDRAAAYMPMPIQVSGTNSNPIYTSLPGFDAKYGTLHSPYLLNDYGTGVNGALRNADVADGMHPISSAFGVEMSFDLGDGFKIENKGRIAQNGGRFITPFPASVGSTASILSTIAGTTGWNLTGATVSDGVTGSAYTGTNAMIIHMFDVELNNFNNFVNDFKLKKTFKGGDVTFGFYKSFQNVGMSWLFNSYLTNVNGNGLHPLLIKNAGGTVMNAGGQFAYGTPLWGNLKRNYDTRYDISAPYLNTTFDINGKLNIDAGVRWDIGKATGSYTGGSSAAKDMNGDGIIAPNETNVESIDYTTTKPVNYKYNYGSYSVGINYKLDDSKAIFARYSSGATTKADRILFTSNILADGSAKGIKDAINQAEFGFKGNFKDLGVFVTGFYANINEQAGFEATTQKIIENHYKSLGVELEFSARISKQFDVKGGATFTKAEITDGANIGNRPRRQAPFIYNFVPTYNAGKLSIGFSTIGTSSSYSQDDNKLKFKGYVLVNPFINYKFTKTMVVSVNANNVFNTLGITEAEESSIVENTTNIIRARSVTGRTIAATISFNF
jgi:outer membrane receptor protein involved in Fe transport